MFRPTASTAGNKTNYSIGNFLKYMFFSFSPARLLIKRRTDLSCIVTPLLLEIQMQSKMYVT